ncbi:hypothetical protein [Neobacillus soli]|uniref:hypothetical protein n=1 Tax=Neobacillus soli TaxID=220688 RepID=UPI00082531B9|nr:hypothetical protein [Neobacillus soli]
MFNKVSLITSLLFFLLGTNVFAHSFLEASTPKNSDVLTESHDNTTAVVLTVANDQAITEVSATETSKDGSENAGLLTKRTKAVEPSFKDYVVPGSVGLLLIAGFGSYWLIFRRKHA